MSGKGKKYLAVEPIKAGGKGYAPGEEVPLSAKDAKAFLAGGIVVESTPETQLTLQQLKELEQAGGGAGGSGEGSGNGEGGGGDGGGDGGSGEGSGGTGEGGGAQ